MHYRTWLLVATIACTGSALVWAQGCSSSSPAPGGAGGGGGTAGGGAAAGGGGHAGGGGTSAGGGGGTSAGGGGGTSAGGGGGTSAGGGGGTAGGGGGTAGGGGGAAGGGGTAAGINCLGGGDGGEPTTPCSTGQCCTDTDAGAPSCSTSCAAPDQLNCLQPSDCADASSDAGECCGTIVVNGGTFPACNITSFGSACGICSTNVVGLSQCTGTNTLHFCATSADCASSDPNNTLCCTIDSKIPNVCISTGIENIAHFPCD